MADSSAVRRFQSKIFMDRLLPLPPDEDDRVAAWVGRLRGQKEEKADAAGVMTQVVKLFPLDPAKKPFHTVVLTVDKAKTLPRSIQVLYKDGNVVTYTLKKFTPNVELADALFTFDKSKYPGVEENDMR